MAKDKRQREREQRISMEIIVDAYGPEEQAIGWYCYLQDRLRCPFQARCIAPRAVSPLRPNEKVEVVGMAPEVECEHEMFVMVRREKGEVGVPLAQLRPVGADDETTQAIQDWHYWVRQEYQL